MVTFGKNRDGKRGHEQITLGLLTNTEGCPVACEVFAGNTADQSTVLDNQAVLSYRRLAAVEQAFRNIKTVALEIRPVYHHLDDRIRAHVFLCMLAYYVQWHMWQRLRPLLDNDGKQCDRRWSWEIIIKRLSSIRKEKMYLGSEEIGDI